MIFLLDFLKTLLSLVVAYGLSIVVTYGLYYLYRRIFIEGYVKKIKKAIDDNDMEKAEKMKAVALKRQPNRIPALLVKYKIEEEKDNLQPYEIDPNGMEGSSSVTVELQLNTKDLFRFNFWYLLNRSSAASRTIWLVILILVFISLIVNFTANALAFTIVLVCCLIINRIKVYMHYRRIPKDTVRMEFFSDEMVLKKRVKTYGIGRADIEKVYNTKKYLYAIVKNKTVIIIPKRFVSREEIPIILNSLNGQRTSSVVPPA